MRSFLPVYVLFLGGLLAGCATKSDSPAPTTPVSTTVTIPPTTTTTTAASDAVVTTYAGTRIQGFADGTATAARFDTPRGVAVDAQGIVYVADLQRIRKIALDGTVSTLAGSGVLGYKDGTGTAAQFANPVGLICDAQGNIYVNDGTNTRIRKITPTGVVTTVAGNGGCSAVDGPAASASFCGLAGIAIAPNGDLYVCDSNNHRIRKISNGQVTTVAGSKQGYADGTGTQALFDAPTGIAIDSKGNLFVSDFNDVIRKITPQGVVSTFVGTAKSSDPGNADNGTGAAAYISHPYGMVCDDADNIYVAETTRYKIRKITPAGVVTTVAGAVRGYKDGIGTAAQFDTPWDIKTDNKGNFYVAEFYNYVVRKIVVK